VDSWFIREALRRERESAVLPLRIPRPGLLKSSYVRARCVDLIVPLGLEVVEMLDIFIKIRDTGSGLLIGACSSFSHDARVINAMDVPKVISPRMTRSVGFCAIRGILFRIERFSLRSCFYFTNAAMARLMMSRERRERGGVLAP